MPPDKLFSHVRSDTLKRMYVTRRLGKNTVQHEDVQDVPRIAVITKPVTRTHAGTGCEQNCRRGKRVFRQETITLDARNQEKSIDQVTNVLCQRNGIPPKKFWRMGEEDVTMRQNISDTSGASSSNARRGPVMHIIDGRGNEPQMSKQTM